MSRDTIVGELEPQVLNPKFESLVRSLRDMQPRRDRALDESRQEAFETFRGCGPDALALAKYILFKSEGTNITATMASEIEFGNGIHLVFGIEKNQERWVEHVWIEFVDGDQTLIVSPESSAIAPRESFRTAVIMTNELPRFYEKFGYERFKADDPRVKTSADDMAEVEKVIEQINAGKVPDSYKSVQTL